MPRSGSLLLLPEPLLEVAVADDEVHPRYLGERDRLWIEELLDRFVALAGERRADVEARLFLPSQHGAPRKRWRAMSQLLVRLHRFEIAADVVPRELRAQVFPRAAALRREQHPVQAALRPVAGEHQATSAAQLVEWLYADLPSERRLVTRSQPLDVVELIERYNLALAQSLLLRAQQLSVTVGGNVKGLLRFARLQGLLCLATAVPGAAPRSRAAPAVAAGARLLLSGPLGVLRHTIKYGRSLAAWLPVVIRSPGWSLEARCVLRKQHLRWCANARDPIGTTHAPLKRFDSKLEERFFRDFARRAPNWRVQREVDPVQIGQRIVCPDFTLADDARGLRVPVEIVGFWTARYLRDKLDTLRRLPANASWLVCVDRRLDGPDARTIAALPQVFCFDRHIDITAFLDHLERFCDHGTRKTERAQRR